MALRDNKRDSFAPLTDEERDFVSQHVPLALYFTNLFLPPNVERQEAAQEGMLGMMRSVKTYDPSKGKFSTYAMRPVRQRVIRTDAYFNKVRAAEGAFLGLDMAQMPEEEIVSNASRAERQAQKEALWSAVNKLAPNKRKLLISYYYENMTLKYIGQHMLNGVGRERARQVVAGIVAELRDILERDAAHIF